MGVPTCATMKNDTDKFTDVFDVCVFVALFHEQ